MDLLSMLKLSNIFSPTGQTTPQNFPIGSVGGQQIGMDTPSQGGIAGDQPDLNTAIQQLLNPQDTQFKSFSDLINQMPQRSAYQPSKFRQVAAAIAGMGTGSPVGIANGQVVGFKSNIPEGLKVQQAIKDEPYNQALTDWANKLEPTGKIAQMEANRNVNLRQTGLGALQRQQQQEKIDETERQNEAKNKQAEENIAIRKQRADVYEYKAKNPNSIIKEDSNGNLIAIDPQTNKSDTILDSDGNPVKSSVMTDAEKLKQVQENKEKEITLRGTQSRLTEGFKQANRMEMESTRQINRKDLKTTPAPARPGSSTEKPLTPSAERTANQNKAVAIINEHPELQKYFEVGGNKLPTGQLVAPKDPNDAGYQIAQRLMGKTSDIKLPSDINPKVNIESSVPSRELTRPEDPRIKAARAKVESGYVLITDGKSFGQVKPEDTAKLPKGWMVVK